MSTVTARRTATLEALVEATVVGVVRSPDAASARARFTGLMEAGLRALEITANTPEAFAIVQEHAERAERSGIVLGVGTVRRREELQMALEAGARFVVSPHTDPELINTARKLGLVCIPGALTPTEIVAAAKAGADVVKVFPVSAVGGARYLRLLSGPLGDIPLWVSGDVAANEVAGYLDAGASLVGLTSALSDPHAEDPQSDARDRAGAVLKLLSRARESLTLLAVSGAARLEVALTHIRRLPGEEFATLEAIAPGRRGHVVRLRQFLAAAKINPSDTVELKSHDGFARRMAASALYDGGFVHYATDGHPLSPAEGGPLRLYVTTSGDRCDDLKGLAQISVVLVESP